MVSYFIIDLLLSNKKIYYLTEFFINKIKIFLKIKNKKT